MAAGEQTRKPKPKEEEAPQETEAKAKETDTDEVTDLLDEIDEVLESNAEDFVRSFVQKGGQAMIPLAFFDVPAWVVLVLVAAILIAGLHRPFTGNVSVRRFTSYVTGLGARR